MNARDIGLLLSSVTKPARLPACANREAAGRHRQISVCVLASNGRDFIFMSPLVVPRIWLNNLYQVSHCVGDILLPLASGVGDGSGVSLVEVSSGAGAVGRYHRYGAAQVVVGVRGPGCRASGRRVGLGGPLHFSP